MSVIRTRQRHAGSWTCGIGSNPRQPGEPTSAGFTTVVQDNIYGVDVDRWLDDISPSHKHLVVLRPRIEVIEAHDAQRRRTLGKIAYRDGFTPTINDQHVASTRRDLGLWLDTSDQTPKETVDEILGRSEDARVQ